jgi:hypothetical protein
MNKQTAKFLFDVIETAVNSVVTGQSRQARVTLTAGAAPKHFVVDRDVNGYLAIASNDRDFFCGQPPSVLVLTKEPHNGSAFTRVAYKALAPQVDDEHFQARIVLNFHPPLAKSPRVLVGNSKQGTLDPELDKPEYEL